MGAASVRQAEQIIHHVETIVAIELLLAAQGINFRLERMGKRSEDLGRGTAVAFNLVREEIPFVDEDLVLATLIEKARVMVASGAVKRAVEAELGL